MIVMACTGRQESKSFGDDFGLAPRTAARTAAQDRCQVPSRQSFDRWSTNRQYSKNVALPSSLQLLRPNLRLATRTDAEPLSDESITIPIPTVLLPRLSESQPPSSYHSPASRRLNPTRPNSLDRPRSDNNSTRSRTSNSSEEEKVIFLGRHSSITEDMQSETQHMNIAVINAAEDGQTSFLHQVFDLPGDAVQSRKPNIYSMDEKQYAIRFFKSHVQHLRYTDEGRIIWPTLRDLDETPSMHAAVVVYEVTKADGLSSLAKLLHGLKQTLIPTVLVPSRSVQFASVRTRERDAVEETAKSLCNGIDVFHVADPQTELQKRCVSVLLVRHVQGPKIVSSGTDDDISTRVTNHESGDVRQVTGRDRADSKLSMGAHSHPGSATAAPGEIYSTQSSGFSFEAAKLQIESSDGDIPSDDASSRLPTSPTASTGCNLDDLVCRLLKTPITIAENNFTTIFLATYRMFAAPSDLLQCIISKYQNSPHDRHERFSSKRCLDVIDRWIHSYTGDFAHALTRTMLTDFLATIVVDDADSSTHETISAKLDKVEPDSDTEWANADSKLGKSREGSASGNSSSNSESSTPRVSVNLPQSVSSLAPNPKRPFGDAQWRQFMIQDEDTIAQDLAHISHTLFSALPLRDLLRHATPSISSSRNTTNSPLGALTAHFNHLAHWTSNIILLPRNPKSRSLILSKLMRVARKIRQLNDYNTVAALLAGMQATSIHRLRQTWDLITPEQYKDYRKLEILMTNARGSASYRLAWENTRHDAGHVPFLAVHQRDLVVAIAGGRTFVESPVSNPIDEQAVGGLAEFRTQPSTPASPSFTDPSSTTPTTANTSFSESTFSAGPSTPNTSFTSYTSTTSIPSQSYTCQPQTSLPSRTTTIRRRINWSKFEVIGATLLTLRAAQQASYTPLRQSETVRALVLESVIERDEEELYQRSCLLEPVIDSSAGGAGVGGGAATGQAVGGMRAWVGRLGRGMSDW